MLALPLNYKFYDNRFLIKILPVPNMRPKNTSQIKLKRDSNAAFLKNQLLPAYFTPRKSLKNSNGFHVLKR